MTPDLGGISPGSHGCWGPQPKTVDSLAVWQLLDGFGIFAWASKNWHFCLFGTQFCGSKEP